MMSSYISFIVKQERKKIGLTQLELAKMTGLGLKTIRKIEQGDQQILLSKLNYLLCFFGLELSPQKLMVNNSKKRIELNKEKILETLKTLGAMFEKRFGIKKLGLFGSFSRQEKEANDIDILFEGDLGLAEQGEMSLILERMFAGYKIDLTNEKYIDPRLRAQIMEDVIYV